MKSLFVLVGLLTFTSCANDTLNNLRGAKSDDQDDGLELAGGAPANVQELLLRGPWVLNGSSDTTVGVRALRFKLDPKNKLTAFVYRIKKLTGSNIYWLNLCASSRIGTSTKITATYNLFPNIVVDAQNVGTISASSTAATKLPQLCNQASSNAFVVGPQFTAFQSDAGDVFTRAPATKAFKIDGVDNNTLTIGDKVFTLLTDRPDFFYPFPK